MMYNQLASYYDDLVKDEEATQAWVQWIESSCKPCSFLELACGSGEITHQLSQDGFTMDALDLSQDMIDQAQKKDDSIHFYCQNMLDLSNLGQYDAMACLCDSFNYLLDQKEVETLFQEVHHHLNEGGYFFFDTHALDRLTEFEEEWNETGTFEDGVSYQWSIESEDDWIYQDFAFYMLDGSILQEHHLQRVYQPKELEEIFSPYFDVVDIKTDFDLPGIQPGEKYFYVLRKKELE